MAMEGIRMLGLQAYGFGRGLPPGRGGFGNGFVGFGFGGGAGACGGVGVGFGCCGVVIVTPVFWRAKAVSDVMQQRLHDLGINSSVSFKFLRGLS